MEFDDFSLIVRFRGADHLTCMEELLSYYSAEETAGMKIYEKKCSSIDGYPVECCLFAMTGTPLKSARHLYRKFTANKKLMSEVLFARSFPQHNELLPYNDLVFIGQVDNKGTIIRGNEPSSYTFSGKNQNISSNSSGLVSFYSDDTPGDIEILRSSPESFMRLIPISNSNAVNVMRLCFAFNAECIGNGIYAMYDRRIVLTSEDFQQIQNSIETLKISGYSSFLVPAEFDSYVNRLPGCDVYSGVQGLLDFYPLIKNIVLKCLKTSVATPAAKAALDRFNINADGMMLV